MLNRRILRIKVFQSLYSFYKSDNNELQSGINNLMRTLTKMHELFICNLSFLIKLQELATERIENNKTKFIPAEEDKNPNCKFINNIVFSKLSSNYELNKLISAYKVSWAEQQKLIKKILIIIQGSIKYAEYMHNSENNFEEDKSFLTKIYKKYIYNNSSLIHFFEEANIHWGQDQYYIGSIILNFIKNLNDDWDEKSKLPEVFKNNYLAIEDSDEYFVKKLFEITVLKKQEYEDVIEKYLQNWDIERVAFTDMIIIKMAICEILNFPQIPIKPSINEYIEISKSFSTPKSKIFINGVLDQIIAHYKRNNMIEKYGRGLREV